MKKISLFAALAVGLLATSSCSNEAIAPEADNTVTFSVGVPVSMGSRAFNDGLKADKLTWAIFDVTDTTTPVLTSESESAPAYTYNDKKFTITFNLVKGKTYDFMFFATPEESIYTVDSDYRGFTADYANMKLNDDNTDAFFNVVKGISVTGSSKQSVELRRPFAQVNLGTNDTEIAAKVNTVVKNVTMKMEGVYSKLNFFSGVASDPVETLLFDVNNDKPLPTADDGKFPFQPEDENATQYDYLAMGYVLTGTEIMGDDVQKAQQELKKTSFTLNFEDGQSNEILVETLPVQRNYRTNVYGSLITAPQDWTIIIEPDFWDENNIEIETVSDAQSLQAALNAGKEAVLIEDIELTTPINIKNDAVLNLNGKTLTSKAGDWNDVLSISKGNVTIKGGTIVCEPIEGNNYGTPIYVKGAANVTIEDVTVEGIENIFINNTGANVTIKSGTFNSSGSQCLYMSNKATGSKMTVLGGEYNASGYDAVYTVNLHDALMSVAGAKATDYLEVKGGKFHNYNPADSKSENPAVSFVPAGYKSVETEPGIWEVVAE